MDGDRVRPHAFRGKFCYETSDVVQAGRGIFGCSPLFSQEDMRAERPFIP